MEEGWAGNIHCSPSRDGPGNAARCGLLVPTCGQGRPPVALPNLQRFDSFSVCLSSVSASQWRLAKVLVEKYSLVTKYIPLVEVSLDFVFEPREIKVPSAEARGDLMASYIDMAGCKVSEYGEFDLNDASNEQATPQLRCMNISWRWETGCLKDLTEPINSLSGVVTRWRVLVGHERNVSENERGHRSTVLVYVAGVGHVDCRTSRRLPVTCHLSPANLSWLGD